MCSLGCAHALTNSPLRQPRVLKAHLMLTGCGWNALQRLLSHDHTTPPERICSVFRFRHCRYSFYPVIIGRMGRLSFGSFFLLLFLGLQDRATIARPVCPSSQSIDNWFYRPFVVAFFLLLLLSLLFSLETFGLGAWRDRWQRRKMLKRKWRMLMGPARRILISSRSVLLSVPVRVISGLLFVQASHLTGTKKTCILSGEATRRLSCVC